MGLGSDSAASELIHPLLTDDLQVPVATLFGSTAEFGESIIIRRDGTPLASQDVRLVVQSGRSSQRESPGAEQLELNIFVAGGPSLDIEVGDYFNDSAGTLYKVTFVRPNRQIQTVAEARAEQ